MATNKRRKLDGSGNGSGNGSGSGNSTPTAEANQTQSSESEKGRPDRILIRQYSSFKPNKKNLQKKAGGRLVLTTQAGERLVILGSFGIKVREGEATVAGAILTPVDDVQWVHAPHCHAVPVLRTADDTVLELHPHPAAKGLRQLANLNPGFAKLWNETANEADSKARSSTFEIIYTSQDVPKRAVLQELVSPAEWNKKLSGLVAAKRKGTPVIFMCGPKSSGKSTFGRLLANRLMTDRGGTRNKPWSTVMVLDVDPGQPEYSPPGVISLCKITTPNLSPSFCHPTLSPAEGQVRAHAIASVTPAQDPAHFIECVLDLFAHYQQGPDAKCPLVINTPGWIQGTGLDILTELIASIQPTEVIYMSQDGPDETVNTLRSACTTTTLPTPFSSLPSQPNDSAPARTSLHFRTMQTMSYFHLAHQHQTSPLPSWNPTPLTALRPWRVRYPAPDLLAEAINGTVLALVKVENRAAAFAATAASSSPRPSTTPHPLKTPKYRSSPTRRASPSPRHSRFLCLVLVRGIDPSNHELQLLTPLPRETVASLAGSGAAAEQLVLVAGGSTRPRGRTARTCI
ncbi:hypothetical protein NEMBOFW57_003847 [Staphylotrichum longicolle]|uniref:Polynucleotide 5'-hydroxyl-kinase GRC3 n=1 Tax=Staphylotrichum longicolle TaxID=669026 RepID=A0AAD4I525_9PEZI|nr:hypothetical protein NEMBOFW57_003847 [Staphylotrichum longicolle]